MKLSTFEQANYDGGLNNTTSSREIKSNEAAVLENWDITVAGKLTLRDGITATGGATSADISGLTAFVRTNGSKDLLLTEGTNLKYLNSTTWTNLDTGFTAGTDFSFAVCPVTDVLYLGNEENTQHSWDRVSTTADSCLTDLGAAVPHGNIMRWHKNHMFVLNNATVSGTAYPNRMYWSAMADPDTYDTTNDWIDVPGNGRLITAMDLGDSLILFKERGIQYLDGWGDTDWKITASASNVTNLDEQVGTVSPYGVTRVGNEVWFMDEEANIRRITRTDFDAFRRDIISTKVRGTLDNINYSQLSKVKAWTHNDKVYFSLPMGSDSTNSTILVYDIIASRRTGEEAWTTYTGWSINHFLSYPTNDRYNLYVAAARQVYQHTGTADGATAITATYEGKVHNYKYPERYKRYKFGYLTGESGSDSDITIHSSIDDAAYGEMGTLNLNLSGSELGPTGTDTLGPTGTFRLAGPASNELKFYYEDASGAVTGKRVQHKITASTSTSKPSVNGFTSHYKLRTLR